MKYFNSIIGLFILVLVCSCSEDEVPNQTFGNFTTMPLDYNCIDDSPLIISYGFFQDNFAEVTAQMTSIAAPQYDSGLQVYDFQSYLIDASDENGCASVRLPDEGEYTSVIRFIEGNDFCQPAPNTCWRWWAMQTHPAGFVPSCSNFNVSISGMDPTGFEGSCWP